MNYFDYIEIFTDASCTPLATVASMSTLLSGIIMCQVETVPDQSSE